MLACARRAVIVLLAFLAAMAVGVPVTAAATRTVVAGAPPHSSATAAVTGTRLTLAPHHRTIHYHHAIRLTARLTGRFGPLSDTDVAVWARRAGHTWHRVTMRATGKQGRVTWRARLRHTTRWQVRYAGDLLHDAAKSPVATVHVLPPPPPPPPAPTPFGVKVIAEAAKHKGAPYEYGAAGPHRFDCSGFTMYVFGKFGISLPHNAAAQYDDSHHVAKSNKRVGDLVFFYDSGGIYHVGIFAGHGRMWAATHTGDYVRLESIYSASYLVGRVHPPR